MSSRALCGPDRYYYVGSSRAFLNWGQHFDTADSTCNKEQWCKGQLYGFQVRGREGAGADKHSMSTVARRPPPRSNLVSLSCCADCCERSWGQGACACPAVLVGEHLQGTRVRIA